MNYLNLMLASNQCVENDICMCTYISVKWKEKCFLKYWEGGMKLHCCGPVLTLEIIWELKAAIEHILEKKRKSNKYLIILFLPSVWSVQICLILSRVSFCSRSGINSSVTGEGGMVSSDLQGCHTSLPKRSFFHKIQIPASSSVR